MNIFFDTEFMENETSLTLISLGAQDQLGRIFYAESNEFDPLQASPWVRDNVLSQLGTVKSMSNKQIAYEFRKWVDTVPPRGTEVSQTPKFFGYFSDYDWVLLCRLYGGMMKLPDGWPQLCLDIKQEALRLDCTLPGQNTKKHRADNDALWTKDAHCYLVQYEEKLFKQNIFRINGRTVKMF